MRLHIEPEAEAELEEAADQYEEAVPGLGLDFILEMRERTEQVLPGGHVEPFDESWQALEVWPPMGRQGRERLRRLARAP